MIQLMLLITNKGNYTVLVGIPVAFIGFYFRIFHECSLDFLEPFRLGKKKIKLFFLSFRHMMQVA